MKKSIFYIFTLFLFVCLISRSENIYANIKRSTTESDSLQSSRPQVQVAVSVPISDQNRTESPEEKAAREKARKKELDRDNAINSYLNRPGRIEIPEDFLFLKKYYKKMTIEERSIDIALIELYTNNIKLKGNEIVLDISKDNFLKKIYSEDMYNYLQQTIKDKNFYNSIYNKKASEIRTEYQEMLSDGQKELKTITRYNTVELAKIAPGRIKLSDDIDYVTYNRSDTYMPISQNNDKKIIFLKTEQEYLRVIDGKYVFTISKNDFVKKGLSEKAYDYAMQTYNDLNFENEVYNITNENVLNEWETRLENNRYILEKITFKAQFDSLEYELTKIGLPKDLEYLFQTEIPSTDKDRKLYKTLLENNVKHLKIDNDKYILDISKDDFTSTGLPSVVYNYQTQILNNDNCLNQINKKSPEDIKIEGDELLAFYNSQLKELLYLEKRDSIRNTSKPIVLSKHLERIYKAEPIDQMTVLERKQSESLHEIIVEYLSYDSKKNLLLDFDEEDFAYNDLPDTLCYYINQSIDEINLYYQIYEDRDKAYLRIKEKSLDMLNYSERKVNAIDIYNQIDSSRNLTPRVELPDEYHYFFEYDYFRDYTKEQTDLLKLYYNIRANYIKLNGKTIFLDITRDDAIEQGLPAVVYDYLAQAVNDKNIENRVYNKSSLEINNDLWNWKPQ